MTEALAPLGFGDSDVPDTNTHRIVPRQLTRPQKAAVIVRLLIAEGAELPLGSLDDATQSALTQQMAGLRLIDRATLQATIAEFAEELEAVGLSLPGNMARALDVLDGHINNATAARLRREAGVAAKGNPWERLSGLDVERLRPVIEAESDEVGAILLSKLDVSKAAALLGEIPPERARKMSYAISRTGRVAPEIVERVGLTLASQLDAEPATAFETEPVARVGAILNSSRTAVRDDVLDGLDAEDEGFAAEVRRAIFTFASIPQRLAPRDVPKIVKTLEQSELVTALAFASSEPSTAPVPEFVLENLGKRMAEQIRTEIGEMGDVKAEIGEEAMMKITTAIREKADSGELVLVAED